MRESTSFQLKYRPVLAEIANLDWDNVVVLADGPICGIAEEGALAFTEISMLTGRYFHLLDYRHGPIVVSGKRTLTLALLRPGEEKLQSAMMKDVIQRGGLWSRFPTAQKIGTTRQPIFRFRKSASSPHGAFCSSMSRK
mgnify:CR=1 FL=1